MPGQARVSTLVVLAAGLASRYGSDKQLEPVGPAGETLLEYALYDAGRAGCRRAVLVIREALRPALAAEVVAAWRARFPVELVVQRPDAPIADVPPGRRKPWGTAHALLAARPHVPGEALVCNADDFYGAGAFAATVSALHAGAHVVAGYPLERTLSPHGGVSRALCETGAGLQLLRIEERTGIVRDDVVIRDDRGDVLSADAPVSMNLWGFQPSFFPVLEHAFREFVRARGSEAGAELRIPDVVNGLVAAGGAVKVVPVTEQWFGMTYAADRPAVRAALAERVAAGEYPPNLRAAR